MDWKAIVGILCLLYSASVIWIAYKMPPKLWKIVKMKFGNLQDKKLQIICYVFAGIFAVGGIVLLALSKAG